MKPRSKRWGKGETRYIVPLPDVLRPANEGEHWTATGRATKAGYRFCEGCHSSQPANSRPHRKGWRCSNCKPEVQPENPHEIN